MNRKSFQARVTIEIDDDLPIMPVNKDARKPNQPLPI